MKRVLLLDIMLGDEFLCQLRYDGHGFPTLLENGTFVEEVRYEDLQKFVEDKKPSLIGKDYHIEFSNQRV